jgi:hypothetical protein
MFFLFTRLYFTRTFSRSFFLKKKCGIRFKDRLIQNTPIILFTDGSAFDEVTPREFKRETLIEIYGKVSSL